MPSHNAVAVRVEPAPASMNQQHAQVLDLLARGNLNGLSNEQILQVYIARCDAMGVDARTQPFDILTLRNNKILYPNARLADQLIGQRGLSVEVLNEETTSDGLYRVRVKVSDRVRSVDASAALLVKGLSGESLANAWMKCETKATRRGVLRFCGLGGLPNADDEERRKLGLRRIHAAGADAGLDHDQIRSFAQEHYAIESMTELDADDLAELSDALEAQLAIASDVDPYDAAIADGLDAIAVDPETGEILDAASGPVGLADPDVLATWQPIIEAASSLDELDEVQKGIKDAGINGEDHPELLRVFKSQLNRLKIEAAKANRAAQDKRERANAAANAA